MRNSRSESRLVVGLVLSGDGIMVGEASSLRTEHGNEEEEEEDIVRNDPG